MPTDLRNGQNGRNHAGQFTTGNRGGPGRPKGCENRATADAKRVKAELLGTWDELGPDAVRRLAKDDPGAYVSLIAKLLPTEADEPAAADQEPNLIDACRVYFKSVAEGSPLLAEIDPEGEAERQRHAVGVLSRIDQMQQTDWGDLPEAARGAD